MSVYEQDDRCEQGSEDDVAGDARIAADLQEQIEALLQEHEASAHRLAQGLDRLGVLDRWAPGYEGAFGFVHGRFQSTEDTAVALASDVRANATWWLIESVRGAFQ